MPGPILSNDILTALLDETRGSLKGPSRAYMESMKAGRGPTMWYDSDMGLPKGGDRWQTQDMVAGKPTGQMHFQSGITGSAKRGPLSPLEEALMGSSKGPGLPEIARAR
jgi:hypothetical protein